jgi:hypothetical protein
MHNQEQHPFFGHSDCGISALLVEACIFNANKAIEEYLTCNFKVHTMLVRIDGRLVRVPYKVLTQVKKVEVHLLERIYVVYSLVKQFIFTCQTVQGCEELGRTWHKDGDDGGDESDRCAHGVRGTITSTEDAMDKNNSARKVAVGAASAAPQALEIPAKSPYDNDADEFVRHDCRG